MLGFQVCLVAKLLITLCVYSMHTVYFCGPHALKGFVVINFHGQLDRIWDHLGDKFLGLSVRAFLESFN